MRRQQALLYASIWSSPLRLASALCVAAELQGFAACPARQGTWQVRSCK